MEFELLIHFHTLFHNVFLHLLRDTAFKYSKYTSQKIQRKHDIYEQGLTIGATLLSGFQLILCVNVEASSCRNSEGTPRIII